MQDITEIQQWLVSEIHAGRLTSPMRTIHDMAVSWRALNPASQRGLSNFGWWIKLPKKDGDITGNNLTEDGKKLWNIVQFVKEVMQDDPIVHFNEPAFNIACEVVLKIIGEFHNVKRKSQSNHHDLSEIVKSHLAYKQGKRSLDERAIAQKKAKTNLLTKKTSATDFNKLFEELAGDYGHQVVDRIVNALTYEIESGHFAIAIPIIVKMVGSLMIYDTNWKSYLDPVEMSKWRDDLTVRHKDGVLYYRNAASAITGRRALLVKHSLAIKGDHHHMGFAIAASIALTHASGWRTDILRNLVKSHQFMTYGQRTGMWIRKREYMPDLDEQLFEPKTYGDRMLETPKPRILRQGARIAWRIRYESEAGHHTNALRLLLPIAQHLVTCDSRGEHILGANHSPGRTTLDITYGGDAIYHPGKDLTKKRPAIMRAIKFGMAHADLWEGVPDKTKAVAVNMLAKLHLSPEWLLDDVMKGAAHYLKASGIIDEASWIDRTLPRIPQKYVPHGPAAQLAA
jgi:hypothetical protein